MKATFQMLLLLLQEGKITELQTRLEGLILDANPAFKHGEDDIWAAIGLPEKRQLALGEVARLIAKLKNGANNSEILEEVYNNSSYPETAKLAIMYVLGKLVGTDQASSTYKINSLIQALKNALDEAKKREEKSNPPTEAKS